MRIIISETLDVDPKDGVLSVFDDMGATLSMGTVSVSLSPEAVRSLQKALDVAQQECLELARNERHKGLK